MSRRHTVIVYGYKARPLTLATTLRGIFSKSAISLAKILKYCRAKTACATASKLGGRHPKAPVQPTGRIKLKKTLDAAFSSIFPKTGHIFHWLIHHKKVVYCDCEL